MSQKSQSIVCVQGISIRLHSMPIISFSPSPLLPPPCSAPHCSALLRPVIPLERGEEKTHEGVTEKQGRKGILREQRVELEGVVHKGGLCLDVASLDLFICCLCLYVSVLPDGSISTLSSQHGPLSAPVR